MVAHVAEPECRRAEFAISAANRNAAAFYCFDEFRTRDSLRQPDRRYGWRPELSVDNVCPICPRPRPTRIEPVARQLGHCGMARPAGLNALFLNRIQLYVQRIQKRE